MSKFFDIIYCAGKNISSCRRDAGMCYVKAPAFSGANVGDVVEFKGCYVDPELKAEGIILFVATTSEEEALMRLIRVLDDHVCTATAFYSRKEIEPEEPGTIPGFDEAIDALHALTIKKEEENNEN